MSGSPRPEENHILDALPPAERGRLFPYLKLVALPLGKALYESGDRLQHIYPDCFACFIQFLNGAMYRISARWGGIFRQSRGGSCDDDRRDDPIIAGRPSGNGHAAERPRICAGVR